jgi:hypothetical protein
MLRFEPSEHRWWQKPLVRLGSRVLPAELAVLQAELQPGEEGAWLNSRGTRSGVIDLIEVEPGKFKTKRADLPPFVSTLLASLYQSTGLSKGAPDLVIWSGNAATIRFVEVKCPHWDEPSSEQLKFLEAANERGFSSSIVEWEFIAGAE